MRTTTRGLEKLIAALPSRHSKIGDLDVLMRSQHDIFGLEVTMADGKVVAIIESSDDLLKVLRRFIGFKSSRGNQELEEFSPLHVFENEVAVVKPVFSGKSNPV